MKKLTVATICVLLMALALYPIVGSQASDGRGHSRIFQASLGGFQEVPAVSTEASGRFTARLMTGSEEISYRLRYQNLEDDVLFAHIHLGQRGANGGVAVFLCGGGSAPLCPQSGSVEGTFDASDIVGPAAQGIAPGEPTAFEELAKAMKAGVTYANVHTDKFPGGEIRGQIRRN